eukprot:gene4873-6829_t
MAFYNDPSPTVKEDNDYLVIEEYKHLKNDIEVQRENVITTHEIKVEEASFFQVGKSSRILDMKARFTKIEAKLQEIESSVKTIKLRNNEKDKEKDFERSYSRVFVIMCLTYCSIYGFMIWLKVQRPELSALIPTIGFNLSTWSLSVVKFFWIQYETRFNVNNSTHKNSNNVEIKSPQPVNNVINEEISFDICDIYDDKESTNSEGASKSTKNSPAFIKLPSLFPNPSQEKRII